ncbi:MAG: acyltransferase, partial [Acidimicrobiales bacterium]|nr:acyltransferase [Acidimicrobiales bacterium]
MRATLPRHDGAAAPAARPRAGEEQRPAGTRRKPAWQSRPVGYQPALDGLRALAVGLVVAYHLGYSGVAGGYIGVEVFFVLSGWLVCALLVNEHHRTGGIGLRDFWLRRARRLLPAVVTVTVGTLAVASVAGADRLAELRTHGAAALAYHLNWRLLIDQRSYFETAGGPSALEHLWSLSIEEQFYLVFPLVCAFVLTRVSRRVAVALALAGALAATVLRFALFEAGTDPSRVYFGTDTRAAGLLAGVALALFWTPNRLRPQSSRRFAAVLDAIALVAAAVLAWYAFGLDEGQAVAFRGGFTAAQLATLALVAVAVYPAPTRTVRLLSARPLRWVGQRSYGIYLVHWPVIVFLSAAPGEQPDGPVSVAAQVALAVGLAALSYRLIEQPIRRRGLGDAVSDARRRLALLGEGRPVAATAMLAAGVVACGLTIGVTRDVVTASPPAPPQPEAVVITSDTTVPPAVTAPPAAPATTAPPVATTGPPAAPTTTAAPATTAPAGPPAYVPTTAIGDSVLVGAAPALAARLGPAFSADAAIGRQMADAAALVADLAARGQLGQVVLLHLGNNGPFTAEQIDEVFAAIGPDRTVLLVNVLVPRRWEGEVNDQLAAAAGRHPNAVYLDWRSLVTAEPG